MTNVLESPLYRELSEKRRNAEDLLRLALKDGNQELAEQQQEEIIRLEKEISELLNS